MDEKQAQGTAHRVMILGKPTDEADAKRMLTMLSGQTHDSV